MNEFKRPVKISPLEISATLYILKQVLHYGKNELNQLRKKGAVMRKKFWHFIKEDLQ